jgi:hypothetical protein
MNITNFLFQYIFNRRSRIHQNIMSFIKGRYIEKWNTLKHIDLACKMNYIFMLKYLENEYNNIIILNNINIHLIIKWIH